MRAFSGEPQPMLAMIPDLRKYIASSLEVYWALQVSEILVRLLIAVNGFDPI